MALRKAVSALPAKAPATWPFSLKPLLTTEDVARILRINIRTVQRLVRARRLPVCTGAGKHWRFDEDAIAQYIRDTTVLARMA
jgi:excisionase family DNA binding protein